MVTSALCPRHRSPPHTFTCSSTDKRSNSGSTERLTNSNATFLTALRTTARSDLAVTPSFTPVLTVHDTQRFWCVSSPCSHAKNFTRSAQALVLLPYHGITPSRPHAGAHSTAASCLHHTITCSWTNSPCVPHQGVAACSFHHTLMPSHQRTQHGCISLASHHHTPMHSHALHATPCRSCSLIPSHPHALTLPHASQLHCRSITSSCTHVLIRHACHAASQTQVHGITPQRPHAKRTRHSCIIAASHNHERMCSRRVAARTFTPSHSFLLGAHSTAASSWHHAITSSCAQAFRSCAALRHKLTRWLAYPNISPLTALFVRLS